MFEPSDFPPLGSGGSPNKQQASVRLNYRALFAQKDTEKTFAANAEVTSQTGWNPELLWPEQRQANGRGSTATNQLWIGHVGTGTEMVTYHTDNALVAQPKHDVVHSKGS